MMNPTCSPDAEPIEFRRHVQSVVNCLEADWTCDILDCFVRYSSADKKIGLSGDYTWYGQKLLSDFMNPPKTFGETKREVIHERGMATVFVLQNSGVPAKDIDPHELVECLFTVYCRYRTNQPIGIAKLSGIAKVLLRYAGKGKGLPSDLSRNHDHYLHE